MRGSLGLSAYRTVSGRRSPPEYAPVHDRPEGDVVWIHNGADDNNRALNDLAHRLESMRPGCHIVLTASNGTYDARGNPAVLFEPLPSDHPVVTDNFIKHWKPSVVIWAWGGLRPNLVLSAARSDAFMMLVDVARDGFDRRRDRWLPEVPRRLLAEFQCLIARDQDAHLRLAQLGCPLDSIELAAPLHPFGHMLPAPESDLAELTEAMGGRPSWLSARTSLSEGHMILAAHHIAIKTSPRLLLILHLADPANRDRLAAQARKFDLRVALWSDGVLPDDNTQVLLTDEEDELGLWLRIAPVTFLGGLLRTEQEMIDPYSAAAHGTALIYGPSIGSHVDAYTRLMNAGAARIVNSTDTLGRAVIQMIAPDHAAQMAMAGWDVVTQGADSLDRIIDIVQTQLDERTSKAN